MHIMPLMARLNPRFREKILLLLSDIVSVDSLFEDEASCFVDRQGHPGDARGVSR